MKKLTILFLFTAQVFSQTNINQYKYIDVPKKYDFLKSEDKYQLNSLTRFLFKKNGFLVLPDINEHPDDYRKDICTGLKLNVINTTSMFNTKLKIQLIDCNGKTVFTSKEGKSREKNYKKSYHEAMRNAFKSVEELNYVYTPIEKPVVNDVNIIKSSPSVEKEVEKEVIEQVSVVKTVVNENTLYAQPTVNGYQLVDMSPRVVFILKKTSIKDVYLIVGKDGTVSYKNGKWVAEYYDGEDLKHEILSIKF